MDYKKFILLAALGLSACNGPDSPTAQTATPTSTFATDQGPPTGGASPGTTAPGLATTPAIQTGLTDEQKRQQSIAQAQAMLDQGRFEEAADLFNSLGMIPEAKAASTRAAEEKLFAQADTLARDGFAEDAYKLFTPGDYALNDSTVYGGQKDSRLDVAVDEKPAVKRHSMQIGGKTVWFTARAGHLTASNPKDKSPEASIFYTYYSRDDRPREKRPVTFFFNGGPGESSIWLHMGSWAPKRLVTNEPDVSSSGPPSSFPQIDNAETLLDQTDLVFVDPTGTGFSEAISPHTNRDFWGVNQDVEVDNDFVTRFINYYSRQSSPKYLYGESYSGIRVPKMAARLIDAGTANFEPEPAGRKPVGLTGIVLNSPVLDYRSAGFHTKAYAMYPFYAMVSAYFGKSPAAGNQSVEDLTTIPDILQRAKNLAMKVKDLSTQYDFYHFTFAADDVVQKADPDKSYLATFENDPLYKYFLSPDGASLLEEMYQLTGYGLNDKYRRVQMLTDPSDIVAKILPHFQFNAYNYSMWLYSPDFNFQYDHFLSDYQRSGFTYAIKPLLADFANYSNASGHYVETNVDANSLWWSNPQSSGDDMDQPTSLPDLVKAVHNGDGLKVVVVGGFTDYVTLLYNTELDLAGVGLTDRVPVKWFNGGHMTYLTEMSRKPMKAELDKFYAAPPVDDSTPTQVALATPVPVAPPAIPVTAPATPPADPFFPAKPPATPAPTPVAAPCTAGHGKTCPTPAPAAPEPAPVAAPVTTPADPVAPPPAPCVPMKGKSCPAPALPAQSLN